MIKTEIEWIWIKRIELTLQLQYVVFFLLGQSTNTANKSEPNKPASEKSVIKEACGAFTTESMLELWQNKDWNSLNICSSPLPFAAPPWKSFQKFGNYNPSEFRLMNWWSDLHAVKLLGSLRDVALLCIPFCTFTKCTESKHSTQFTVSANHMSTT